MRYVTSSLLFLAFAWVATSIRAQRLAFENYSMNEGLIHNHVRDIFQDSKGFLWISTWEGVSMFDGYKFINYNASNGLSWSLINQVFESIAGDICIASNHGDIDRIQNHQRLLSFLRGNIVFNRFCKIAGGKYFALTDYDGIYEFNDGVLIKPAQSRPTDSYYDIVQVNDSLLLGLNYSSIQLMDLQFNTYSELPGISDQRCLLVDSKKRVWVGTAEGLILLSPLQEKGKPIQLLPLPEIFNIPQITAAPIKDLLEDDRGNIWIGTTRGVIKIGIDGSRQLIDEQNGLPSNQITCLMQDREKNIWFGTPKGVAFLVTSSSIRIFTVEDGLSSNNIRHLLPLNNGNIIVSSEKGLQLHNTREDLFTPLTQDLSYFSGGDKNNTQALIGGESTETPILNFFKQGYDQLYHSPSYNTSYAYRDRRANYFRPSHSGILVSSDGQNWQNTLTNKDSRALCIDSKENLWVGLVDSGLIRFHYHYVGDTPKVFKQDHYLPGIGIRSLYEDSRGYIWAGTRYDGIFRLQPEDPDMPILHFSQSNGLTSGFVTSIGEDKNGAIWLDFQYGLDKLIPDDSSYRVFNFSRFHNFFTVIQGMTFDKNQELWLSTTGGMVHIEDGEFENLKPLQVYITAASLGDSIYHYGIDREISSGYRSTNVRFEFTAPSFVNAKQMLFSYRLWGSNDNNWSPPSIEHNVSYASLAPGNYRFEVRNRGWNGDWGEAAAFNFRIRPPFWQTGAFITSVVFLLAAGCWLVVRHRIKNIRRKADMRRQIAETEMAALRSQMNPHFIFNCLNSIDNLMQNNEKEKATAYLARFAKLIRAILENSKQELIPVWKDIETLKLYLDLELLRCDHKFDYQMHISDELLEGDYKIPPLVIQPFVENSIQHGLLNKVDAPRELTIEGEICERHIHFRITDNGIGRAQSEKLKQFNRTDHKSFGIKITSERLNLLNRNGLTESLKITDLVNEQNEAIGTQVNIQFNN